MISIISFEKSLLKIFKSFTILLLNKKPRFYNLLKSIFFIRIIKFSYTKSTTIYNKYFLYK